MNTKTKKPFYKRWWFILLVAVFILGAIGSALESDEAKEERAAEEQAKEEEREKKKQEREAEKEKKEQEKAKEKKKEEQAKTEKAEQRQEELDGWKEFRERMLDHYGEYDIINIKTNETHDIFYAYVPNEYKLLADNEKQYYVDEIAPLITEDLQSHFSSDDIITLIMKYADESTFAEKKFLSNEWKIVK